jgi:hypothetical protein
MGTQMLENLHFIELTLDLVPFDEEHPELRSMMTQRMVQLIHRFEPLGAAGIEHIIMERKQLGCEEIEAVCKVFSRSCKHLHLGGLPEAKSEMEALIPAMQPLSGKGHVTRL